MMRDNIRKSGQFLGETRVLVSDKEQVSLSLKGLLEPGPIGSETVTNMAGEDVVINLKPEIRMDGYSIKLTVKQTLEEFVGYDLGGGPAADWDYVESRGANPAPSRPARPPTTPKPVYLPRHTTNSLVLWDGQTMVVGGLSATNKENPNALGTKKLRTSQLFPTLGRTFLPVVSPALPKNLGILVTPTLVDSNGTPIHDPKEMPFSENHFPPQTRD